MLKGKDGYGTSFGRKRDCLFLGGEDIRVRKGMN
jgi:hypothetical protein